MTFYENKRSIIVRDKNTISSFSKKQFYLAYIDCYIAIIRIKDNKIIVRDKNAN